MKNQEVSNPRQFSSREKMPDAAFKLMTGLMWLFDFFGNHSNKKYNLANVETCLAGYYSTSVPNQTADVLYALDMFHIVQEPTLLLKEFHRMLKPTGILILEDGHQPRMNTIQKIEASNVLEIIEETKFHVKCKPV